MQVELAQAEYALPCLRGMWQHLERLGGGGGVSALAAPASRSSRPTAGSPGGACPSSTSGCSSGNVPRAARSGGAPEVPTVALAGYTNVGKSTLLNALTGASVSVENRLFETLDPTTRGYEHEGRRYLVTDTVGFIRRLPHQLVEGFAATLEETLVADVVLHVADGSADEAELERMVALGRGRAEGDRRERAPDPARAEQDRPRRRPRPPAARQPLPRGAAGVGRDGGGARGAEGAAGRAVRVALGARAPARPVRRRRRALGSLRPRRADRAP